MTLVQNSSNLPHVTIIIPVYNAESYIVETLSSAFAQTYKNFDVVCIDDCSLDNSVAIIQEYRKTLGNTQQLILIQLEKNSGPSVARNKGIEIAKGTYILPLDADDKIDPSYMEKAINCFIADPAVDVVYCKAATIGDDVSPYDFPPYNPKEMAVRNLVFATAFFRKSDWACYKGYNENMRTGLEDWDFWLNFTEDNKNFFQIAETLFFYRKHGESRSAAAQKNYSELKKQIKKNHPKIYCLNSYFSNRYLKDECIKKVKEFLRSVRKLRKWVFQIRLKKNEKTIRIFGAYLLNKKTRPPIKKELLVHYFDTNNIQNFGDIINPVVISSLSPRSVVSANLEKAELLAIGSILQGLVKDNPDFKDRIEKISQEKIHIWGTGLIFPLENNALIWRPMAIHALRGKYTQAELSKHTKQNLSNIPLGDPGLLVSKLLTTLPEKKFKVGIIPHYVDQNDPAVEALKLLHPSSTVISILGNPIETLNKIAQCEIILSSAMHGLIAADSLNIPNQWIQFSDKLTGGKFKFNDYYSVFDIAPTVWDIRNKPITVENILSIPERYSITPNQVKRIQDALIDAFPFK